MWTPTKQQDSSVRSVLLTLPSVLLVLHQQCSSTCSHTLQASALGLTPPAYAWITYAWYFDDFWESPTSSAAGNCSARELAAIVRGMLLVGHSSIVQDTQTSIIGNLVSSRTHQCGTSIIVVGVLLGVEYFVVGCAMAGRVLVWGCDAHNLRAPSGHPQAVYDVRICASLVTPSSRDSLCVSSTDVTCTDQARLSGGVPPPAPDAVWQQWKSDRGGSRCV